VTVRIRPARPADRPALTRIQAAELTEFSRDLLSAALEGPLLALVAVADTGPVGYLLAVEDGERAYVPELAVAADRQGQGVGSELLAAGCARFRKRDIVSARVTARADDERAREFYEKREFDPVERVPEHYEDGTNGIVYERDL
jgi:ribosomal-protein-alanine N-acetyltransferase